MKSLLTFHRWYRKQIGFLRFCWADRWSRYCGFCDEHSFRRIAPRAAECRYCHRYKIVPALPEADGEWARTLLRSLRAMDTENMQRKIIDLTIDRNMCSGNARNTFGSLLIVFLFVNFFPNIITKSLFLRFFLCILLGHSIGSIYCIWKFGTKDTEEREENVEREESDEQH